MGEYPHNGRHAVPLLEAVARLMISRGAAAFAARWLAVAAVLVGPAVGARAATAPSNPGAAALTIRTALPALPAQIRYGYDIKQWGKAREFDQGEATAQFGPGGSFAVLRIPIYAGTATADAGQPDADPQHINTVLYAPVVDAVHAALRANPDTVVYANVKSPYYGTDVYAPWMHGPDFPEHYARLLFNFLAYMQSQNVPISALGILNEVGPVDLAAVDGGHMSYAVAYARTVQRLATLIRYARHNPYLPSRPVSAVGTYVGPDSAGPHNDLVNRLDAEGLGRTVNVAATHFYSHGLRHQSTQLANFDAWANGRNKWDTEFHWSQGRRAAHGYAEARDALMSMFANLDHGLSTMVWWNYGDDTAADPDQPVQAELQKQFVDTTAGLYYLPVPSGLGMSAPLAPGGLVARAFIDTSPAGAHTLQLWLINDTPDAQEPLTLTTADGAGMGSVAAQAWIADKDGMLSATPTSLHAELAGSSVVLGSIPPRSLVSVTMTVGK